MYSTYEQRNGISIDEELYDDEQNVPLLGSDAGNCSVSPKDVKWAKSVVNDMKKKDVVNAGAVIELRGSFIYTLLYNSSEFPVHLPQFSCTSTRPKAEAISL